MALQDEPTETPAKRVVTKCGGAKAIASWLGIDDSAVRKWVLRGRIPAMHQQAILDGALERGVELHSSDFFE